MKKLLIAMIVLCLYANAYGQKDYRALLNIFGRYDGFNISRDSTIWIATAIGQVYHTESIYAPWHEDTDTSGVKGLLSDHFERAAFFNRDTGFISGMIYKNDDYNIIYWTNNGGRTWEARQFGPSDRIYTHYYDYDGHAWMSGHGQYIYYSSDFGRTWETKAKIDSTADIRLMSIDFDGTRLGVVGGLLGRIYLTRDNCVTWKRLESPLDQKQYAYLYSQERPTIKKAAICGGTIIINQQGHIFFTELDSIRWKPIEYALDFACDKGTKKLFILDKDRKIRILDEKMNERFISDRPLHDTPECFKAFCGSVYSWHRNSFYKFSEKEFFFTPMYTNDHPIAPPKQAIKAVENAWGVSGKDILQSDDYGAKWYRVGLMPFEIGNIKVLSDSCVVVSDKSLRQAFLFNANSHSLAPYVVSTPLAGFLRYPIKQLEFESGSGGCFHYARNRVTYKLKKNDLFSAEYYEMMLGDSAVTKTFYHSIPLSSIESMLHAIDDRPLKPLRFEDFQFGRQEYEEYSAKIGKIQEDYKNGNSAEYYRGYSRFSLPYDYVDLAYFLNAKDSVNRLDSTTVDAIFRAKSPVQSTTTNWRGIVLINENNDRLLIGNDEYLPNAYDLPWIVTADGMSFASTDIRITRFFDVNAPEELRTSKEHAHIQAIFQMVSYLYEQRIKKLQPHFSAPGR